MGERPIECSQCKKAARVIYKEVLTQQINCTEMCAECPVLRMKFLRNPLQNGKKGLDLSCGTCNTSLESVQMGQPLGCLDCYLVFDEMLVEELFAAGALDPSLYQRIPQGSLHSGRAPDQPVDITFSSKLAFLSNALSDALKGENYEQAAQLRDQINDLRSQMP